MTLRMASSRPALVVLATLAVVLLADQETSDIYKTIIEDVDVDTIINNERVLNFYLKCFFNTGPCSTLAQNMKDKIPEVISTVCGKCTDKQKDIFKQGLKKFIAKRPEDWSTMLKIYDPDGTYWPKVQSFLNQ
ncbi:hypothetical protein AAG570_005332 [Ranatra chinensis]|uniref:Uncharacterized protein n=1 Tax=Ranatra chinensis TaxID=642074 RepID=A0ABD0YEY6_9HEMI